MNSDPSRESRRSFRFEARAVDWDQLREPQRSALRELCALLEAARQELGGTEVRDYENSVLSGKPVWDDPARASRVAFISGGRGSGKTTVYCSLRRLLDRGAPAAFGNGDPGGDKLPSEVRRIVQFRQDFEVLEPLDLEPLPQDTNLLAALAARLVRLAERRVAADPRFPDRAFGRGAPFDQMQGAMHPIQEVRALLRSIAITWNGNLRSRAGNVDLDTFAAETGRVETERFQVNLKLTRALAVLAGALQPGDEHPSTVFVLPVDDFDLNPGRCLELMLLLRMVSTPRLVLLVLGDAEVAQKVFGLNVRGQLLRLLPEGAGWMTATQGGEDVRQLGEQLAAAALRKLLPPGQRFELGAPTSADATRFTPAVSAGVAGTGVGATIGELLGRFPVDVATSVLGHDGYAVAGVRVRTLADLLHPTRATAATEGGPAVPAEVQVRYTGARILEASLRQLADLWARLQRALSDDAAPAVTLPDPNSEEWQAFVATDPDLLASIPAVWHGVTTGSDRRKVEPDLRGSFFEDFLAALDRLPEVRRAELYGSYQARKAAVVAAVGREARAAIEEDDQLSPRARQVFLAAFEVGADGAWDLVTDDLASRARVASGLELELTKTVSVLAPRFREWIVAPKNSPWEQPAPRAEAALILFHDLLQLNRETGVSGPGLAPDLWRLELASTLWDFGPGRQVRLPWPTPAWHSVWKYDLLRAIWEPARRAAAGATRRAPNEALARHLAFHWIAGCTSVLAAGFLARDIVDGGSEDTPAAPSSEHWSKLAAVVAVLAWELRTGDNSARRQRIESWIVALLCLLAPESGVFASDRTGQRPKSVSRHFLDELKGVVESPDIVRAVRMQRARRLAAFVHVGEPGYFRALSVTWVGATARELADLEARVPAETSSSKAKKGKGTAAKEQDVAASRDEQEGGDLGSKAAFIAGIPGFLDELHNCLHGRFSASELQSGARLGPKSGVAQGLSQLSRNLGALAREFEGMKEDTNLEELAGRFDLHAEPLSLVRDAAAWVDHPINHFQGGLLQPGPDEVGVVERELLRLKRLDEELARQEAKRDAAGMVGE